MSNINDWRLTNQENYLKGVSLIHTVYKRNSVNNHDHCEFCWKEFSIEDDSAYCTIDKYHWICEKCFSDFKEIFGWITIRD